MSTQAPTLINRAWRTWFPVAALASFILSGITILDWVKPAAYNDSSAIQCSIAIVNRVDALAGQLGATLTSTERAIDLARNEEIIGCTSEQRDTTLLAAAPFLIRGSNLKR